MIQDDISFVGISDYSLDTQKLPRVQVLSVPDLCNSLDELVKTTNIIVENISPKLTNIKENIRSS